MKRHENRQAGIRRRHPIGDRRGECPDTASHRLAKRRRKRRQADTQRQQKNRSIPNRYGILTVQRAGLQSLPTARTTQKPNEYRVRVETAATITTDATTIPAHKEKMIIMYNLFHAEKSESKKYHNSHERKSDGDLSSG